MIHQIRQQHPEESAEQHLARLKYREKHLNKRQWNLKKYLPWLGWVLFVFLAGSVAKCQTSNVNIQRQNGVLVDATGLPVKVLSCVGCGGGSVTQGTSPWLVSGAVTVSWASAQHMIIDSGATAVTGTFWQATQPVSGTFWQATQPVSGTFWQATQPISGSISNSFLLDATFTGRIPVLGQKAMSGSVPVVIAADQSSLAFDPQGPDAQAATQTGKPVQNGGLNYADGKIYTLGVDSSGRQQMAIVGTVTLGNLPQQPLLNVTDFTDAAAGNPIRGDIINVPATGKWTRLALGGANTALLSNGTDSSWGTITSAYTSGTFTATAHNLLSGIHGDTTAASPVLGDAITGQAGPVWARLAATTATNRSALYEVPTYVATPSAPSVACSNSGGSLATNTIFVKVTETNANGETSASAEASCAVTGPSGSVVVTAPSFPATVTSYTVYDSAATGTELKQSASGACANLAAGVNCTIQVLGAGAAPVTANSATIVGALQYKQDATRRCSNFPGSDPGVKCNNAIADCVNTSYTGCTVLADLGLATVPAGNAVYSTQINIPVSAQGNFKFECEEGVLMQYTGSLYAIEAKGSSGSNDSGTHIKGCHILGTASGKAGIHLQVFGSGSIENVFVSSFTAGDGILNEGANAVNYDKIELTANRIGLHEKCISSGGTFCPNGNTITGTSHLQNNTLWGWFEDGSGIPANPAQGDSAIGAVIEGNGVNPVTSTALADNATCNLAGACLSSNIVTITVTSAPSNTFVVGMQMIQSGFTGGCFNSTFTIETVPTTTSYTYTCTAANTHSGSGSVIGQSGNVYIQSCKGCGLVAGFQQFGAGPSGFQGSILIGDFNYVPSGTYINGVNLSSVGATNSIFGFNDTNTWIEGNTEMSAVTNFYNHTGAVPNCVIGKNKSAATNYTAGTVTSCNITDGATGKYTAIASTTAGASLNIPTGTSPTSPVSGDFWNTSNRLTFYNGTNTFTIPHQVATGTSAMTTAGIATGACGTTVTTAATNALTTDQIAFTRNAAPTNANGGNLILNSWITAGNVNWNYCNPSAGTVTPTAMTLNWAVMR